MEERNLEYIFKKSLGVVSTLTDTSFYNEIVRKFRTPVQAEDVNIETAPLLPDWNDTKDTGLFNLDNDDFASIDFTELHTFDNTYTKNGTKSPGVYLDSSGTVALFVRLKLDKVEGLENLDPSAIVYTKYPIDSSNTSLMDSAYQFDYNSQINVNSSISVFKPYNYTLEYSVDDNTFYQVTNDIGNWSFDTNSGTIIFEDDPKNFNSTINLDSDNANLYFTFVKYVGLQGIQNLIHYNKNGLSGIGTKDPQHELDISGSVIISNNLEIGNVFYTSDTLYVDSSNNRVGINTVYPSHELHVVGDVNISEKLTITNSGFGYGMCPIGTIIIWTNTTGPIGYGEWFLCDGNSSLDSNQYQDLSNVLGSDGGYITLPDFRDRYTKGGPLTGETDITLGGTGNTTDISLTDIPSHSHIFDQHTHNKSANSHHHETLSHEHGISVNTPHRHDTNQHTHDITENASHHHELSHDHSLNSSTHTHSANHKHDGVTETTSGSGGHRHGTIKKVSGFNWTAHKKGNGTSGVQINQTSASTSPRTNDDLDTDDTVTYTDASANTNNSVNGVVNSNGAVINQSANNASGGNTSGTTGISSTTESSPTVTSSSTFGISSTDNSNVVDTNTGYINVSLKEVDQTHNLNRDGSSIDTFSFSATPQCIQIFYYIRAL